MTKPGSNAVSRFVWLKALLFPAFYCSLLHGAAKRFGGIGLIKLETLRSRQGCRSLAQSFFAEQF
jgi:hypothetical protein